MNMKWSSLHFQLVVLAVSLTLTACSKSEDQQDQQVGGFLGGIGATVGGIQKSTGINQAPKYTEPTIDVLRGKLQQFPSEYPVVQYPNSKMIVAEVRPNYTANRPNFVCLSTGDRLETVATYYKQMLYKDGWQPQVADENTAYSSTIWTKGKQKAEVRVSPGPKQGERIIQLLIYPAFGQ